jgi:hypothetical protein
MGEFAPDNEATFVNKKQTREYLGDKLGKKKMAENMFNKEHVVVSDKYRENYDKNFPESGVKEDLRDKVFDGKNWVPKK